MFLSLSYITDKTYDIKYSNTVSRAEKLCVKVCINKIHTCIIKSSLHFRGNVYLVCDRIFMGNYCNMLRFCCFFRGFFFSVTTPKVFKINVSRLECLPIFPGQM